MASGCETLDDNLLTIQEDEKESSYDKNVQTGPSSTDKSKF